MSYKLSITATAVCFALAGCMGSGDGSEINSTPVSGSNFVQSGSLPLDEANADFATLSDAQQAVIGGTLKAAQDPTGTARLDGVMSIEGTGDNNTTRVLMGRLSMDVDFDESSMRGEAGSFALYNKASDGSLDEVRTDNSPGTLAINGTIENSNELVASATGKISVDNQGEANANLALNGTFYTDDADKLTSTGSVTGTMTGGGETWTAENGGYVVTEQ